MKLKGYMSGVVAAGLAGLALLASCNDQWNDHYEGTGGVPEISLMELLRADSRLTRFCEMLEKTQEDTLLASSQTYTVWAPQNEALADVDMDDMDAMRRVVRNHIARYTNPSSTSPEEKIYMLNNKRMSYEGAKQYMNAPIIESDLLAQNGVLHVLKEQITYRPNLMEWMATDPDYSKVYAFISRWNRKQYDASLSTTYDSVFVDYNPMLESVSAGIGLLDAEDSLYTMVIPDNAAWDAAMTRLKPYFLPGSTLTGEALTAYQDSVCESRAGQAILSGLTFPGRYFRNAEGEFAEPTAYDSIFTVDRHIIYKENLRTYFSGYERKEASNGYVYLAKGNLNMADTCTWNPVIEIEGENSYYVTPDVGMATAVRSVTPADHVRGVSNGAYREFTASNNTTGVTVAPEQLRCGKYEIWVDYVPPVMDNLTKKTRMQYTVAYMLENGKMLTTPEAFKDNGLTVQNASEYEEKDGVLVVPEREGVVSQKVGEVTFKTADYYDPMWYYEEKNGSTTPTYNTKIRILFNLTRAEIRNPAEWEMTARFDRIRLVPVLE